MFVGLAQFHQPIDTFTVDYFGGKVVLAQDVVAHFSLHRDLITCRPPRSHRPFRKSNNRGRFSKNLIFRQTAIT